MWESFRPAAFVLEQKNTSYANFLRECIHTGSGEILLIIEGLSSDQLDFLHGLKYFNLELSVF